jgi:cyclopropane-fatty-acyl-phospholipid synthase
MQVEDIKRQEAEMSAKTRLLSLRKLLSHSHERLGLDFGIILWDGSTIPDGLAPGALALHVGDEGVVAALIRSPKLETILNLWVSGRIDLRNGSLFDFVARRPKARIKDFVRMLEKRLVLSVAAKFLFVPRGEPWPLERIHKNPVADGSESANRKNVHYHYALSKVF